MEACKYNVGEFKSFVSGKKKIKPAVANDWEVFTGGFARASDVLNLHSKSLDQKIYDCGTKKFFEFMLEHDVEMKGNKIVGSFVIGSQRVLRRKEDYEATMGTISERKSTLIPKSEWIPGHRYETVCGSTFIYAGWRYVTRSVSNKNGIKVGKTKKNFFSEESKRYYYNTSGIGNVTDKKVVKDLGFTKLPDNIGAKIEQHGKNNSDIVYMSDTQDLPKFELVWIGGGSIYNSDYIMDGSGFTYRRTTEKDSRGRLLYVILEDDGKGNQLAGEVKVPYEYYYDKDTYVTRTFRWQQKQ